MCQLRQRSLKTTIAAVLHYQLRRLLLQMRLHHCHLQKHFREKIVQGFQSTQKIGGSMASHGVMTKYVRQNRFLLSKQIILSYKIRSIGSDL